MSPNESKIVRINSATLIMGPTGSGKTSLLATLAMYVWETYRKVSHLVTTDGGGYTTLMQGLIQQGIVRVWRARTRDLPDGSLSFETCLRAAQGWWPKRLNARTGECPPGVQLVPPITEKYEMFCPAGHLVKTVPFQALLTPAMCPTCKVHTTRENMRVTKAAHQTKGFEDVGAVLFDGLSSMLAWMLQDMGQRAGRLELKGEEGAIGGKVISGDLKLGGNTRSHVGFAQSRAEELVLNSLAIPYLVVPPTWTALTMEATDEGGLSIRGPKLAGRAKTDEGPSWFGNCLETAVVKTEKDERQYRLYLSEFTDGEGVRHLVKHRAAPGTMPPYLEDPPIKDGTEKETSFQSFNLGVFFQLLDKALEQTISDLAARFPDAPGLPDGDGMVEVGEDAPTQVSAPAVQPGTPAQTAPPAASTAPQTRAAALKAPAAPRAPQAPAKPAGGAKPAASRPAPATTAKPAAAPVTPAVPAAPSSPSASSDAAAPVAPVAAAPPAAPAGTKPAWAPPGAPRPPAAAPRIRPGVPAAPVASRPK